MHIPHPQKVCDEQGVLELWIVPVGAVGPVLVEGAVNVVVAGEKLYSPYLPSLTAIS